MAAPPVMNPSAPPRLRYVNETAGAFVLIAVLVVLAALALAPQTWRLFAPTVHLTVRLPPEGSLGLRPGADVLVLGSVVGSVDQIVVDDDGDMKADVSVRGNFSRFVRADSRAVIRKPLGIGDAMIEISRGQGGPLPTDHGRGVIVAVADKAPTEIVDETLRDVRQEALPALRDLRQAIATYALLASDLRERQAQLGQTLGHVNAIADRLENGNGPARALLEDAKLNDDLGHVIAGLRKSTEDLDAVLAASNATVQAVNKTTGQLPGFLVQAQETLRQMQRLAEAAQRSWLLGAGRGRPIDPAAADRLGAERTGTAE